MFKTTDHSNKAEVCTEISFFKKRTQHNNNHEL